MSDKVHSIQYELIINSNMHTKDTQSIKQFVYTHMANTDKVWCC